MDVCFKAYGRGRILAKTIIQGHLLDLLFNCLLQEGNFLFYGKQRKLGRGASARQPGNSSSAQVSQKRTLRAPLSETNSFEFSSLKTTGCRVGPAVDCSLFIFVSPQTEPDLFFLRHSTQKRSSRGFKITHIQEARLFLLLTAPPT